MTTTRRLGERQLDPEISRDKDPRDNETRQAADVVSCMVSDTWLGKIAPDRECSTELAQLEAITDDSVCIYLCTPLYVCMILECDELLSHELDYVCVKEEHAYVECVSQHMLL